MKKRFAYLMACSLVLSQLPTVTLATTYQVTSQTAMIEVTLNLEYPMTQSQDVDLKAILLKEDQVIDEITLSEMTQQKDATYYMRFSDLPLGTYQVRLEGKGYKTYISEDIVLEQTEKHLVVNAGKETFTVGDINGNGQIDETDFKAVEEALGTDDITYDLNGDGQVDIEDLAQIIWSKQEVNKGSAEIYNTTVLMNQILNIEEMRKELTDLNNDTVSVEGEVASLFDGNEETTLSFTSEETITEDHPIRIPVTLTEARAVSQISITAPEGSAPTSGNLVYTDEETGEIVKIPFTSMETLSGARKAGKVITIQLGKQIPLQKITIEVTGTNSQNGLLASISKIEFLQDVVDHAVNQEQGIIKGFTGKAQNEGVRLVWNRTANTTGYKVSYGTKSGEYLETAYTNTNEIEIGGLENFTPYYFVVQATNGDWEGPISKEITVTPEPVDLPSAPTQVKASVFDKAVKLNFRMGDDATKANIYYKKVSDATYTKVADIKSNAFVRNLENDTEYMFYVTSENSAGESKPSQIVKATPVVDTIVEPIMPTVGRIDRSHITHIEMLDSRNTDMKYYPNGFNPETLIDGDFTTHWTASTYQRSRGVRVTFDQPYEMDYVAVVPRLDRDLDRHDGTRKYFEYISYYSIKVWETLDSEPITLFGKTEIPVRQSDGLRLLPFDKMNVAQIEVQIYEWDGAGNSSISEVAFYEYNDIVDQVDGLFADGLHTKLQAGIRLEDIETIEKQLDAAIAQEAVLWVSEEVLRAELASAKEILISGVPSHLGEVIEVVQTRQRSSAQNQNFAADGLSDLQATGTMAYAQEQILVYVDAPEGGNMPKLVVSQFYGDGTWEKAIPLKQGRNVIDIPRVVTYTGEKGGSLYLRYEGEEQDTTTVRIVNARPIPTLELTNLEDEAIVKAAVQSYIMDLTAYVEKLPIADKTTNPANSTEIGTDKVLLSLPAEVIYKGITEGIEENLGAQVERLYESLMTWDVNLKLHYDILGLSEEAEDIKNRYPRSRVNIRYMPMNNGVFMYAAGNHIGIQYDSGAGMVNGSRTAETGYFGWGINHEIGHIINDENYVIAEVTNNIFSLFAQTVNGGASRLEPIYNKVYDKVVSKNTGLSSDVFVNLAMFWQLHLAYDETNEGVTLDGFYPTLHRLSRASNFEGVDRLNTFIRLASDTVQKDLTPFFERWGIHISEETYDYVKQYSKETSALYYLNDDAMRYRLNKGEAAAEGSIASILAEVKQGADTSDTVVELTLSSDMPSEALLGYEIYRDGKLVAFTTEDTYVDDISSNNVTHQYSVVAYDKLLNKSEKFASEEVYIASEGIIAKDEYTTQRTTSGALQIEFENALEVVGLKFNDMMLDGASDAYSVEVSQDGESWTVAKESNFKEGTSLIYFNKPGTSKEDDRIWTYDAKYIRIIGDAVETITDDQINVLEYPGDSVHFTEGAIGKLAETYELNGVTLEKGTLVVMGTYRGHPLYSKIVLSANYVNEKDFDKSERPGYDNESAVEAVEGELYMFAELPEDQEVSKVGNGIWLFAPKTQTLPSQIKANLFRTDDAESTEGGRLVSDTKWLLVPSEEDMPEIKLG